MLAPLPFTLFPLLAFGTVLRAFGARSSLLTAEALRFVGLDTEVLDVPFGFALAGFDFVDVSLDLVTAISMVLQCDSNVASLAGFSFPGFPEQ
jgi:hypothetical protein